MNRANISSGTISRTILLLLALVNQCFSIVGIPLLPIDNEQIETLVTLLWTLVASLMAWWKNNSFTQGAIRADASKKMHRNREG